METSYNCAIWCSATTYQKINSSIVSKGAMNILTEMFPLARMFPLAVMHGASFQFERSHGNWLRSPIFPKCVRNNGFQICARLPNMVEIIICVYILSLKSKKKKLALTSIYYVSWEICLVSSKKLMHKDQPRIYIFSHQREFRNV